MKSSYFSKRLVWAESKKISWIFWCQVHRNWEKKDFRQNLFKQKKKKKDFCQKFLQFLKIIWSVCIFVFIVQSLNQKNISTNVHENIKKFEFWNLIQILYFLILCALFKSTLNWLSSTAKITAVGWLTVKHLRFINEVHFEMHKNSPS